MEGRITRLMDYLFPCVEFPLYTSAQQASGQPRQYLEPRINAVCAGSFSAAAVGANGALMFRRQVRGRYVNYHTPCIPLAPPNIRTPFDAVHGGRVPGIVPQLTHLQWNYKDVYVPPPLLHGLLTESTAVEQQNVEYDPLLGSAIACLPLLSPSSLFTCLFFASGPLLQTLTCGVARHSHTSPTLLLTECDAYQMPGRIMEIQATRTQGKEFVCVRTSYHVAFFEGPSEDALSSVLGGGKDSKRLMTLLAIFRTDHCVSCVTLSPYIAGEGLVVLETGGIYLWCQGQPLQVLQQPLTTPTQSSSPHFWRCCYGNHPRSVLLAEHSGVSLGDFRSSRLQFSPLLTSPCEWLPKNTLTSSLSPPTPSHPHQVHLGTSHSLILLDMRQPGWPLLQESHDLGHAPQIMDATPTHDNHLLVMLCDCVDHESVVFSHGRVSASDPAYSSCAAHVVANYGDLEEQWQGKSALPLLGNRLQLPLAGACLFSLGECSEEDREGEREGQGETFAAVTMSVLGDLFYQLWSYSGTPPTDTPTSCDDSWLQEALLQEQELHVCGEEWHVTSSPVNFNPMLEYLESGSYSVLCPACLATKSTHFPSSLLPSLNHNVTASPSHPSTVTPSHPQTTPLLKQCTYCGGRLAPLRSRKLEWKLVTEGLMEEPVANSDAVTMAAGGDITMATVRGVERLRASCDLRDPGVDGNHDDCVFWEGWREGGEEVEREEAEDILLSATTPTARSQTSTREKPYTLARNKSKRMGF